MRAYGISTASIHAISDIYINISAKDSSSHGETDTLPILVGVLHDDTSTPFLLIISLAYLSFILVLQLKSKIWRIKYHLLTKSEVIIHQGRVLRFACNDRRDEVYKLLFYGLFSAIDVKHRKLLSLWTVKTNNWSVRTFNKHVSWIIWTIEPAIQWCDTLSNVPRSGYIRARDKSMLESGVKKGGKNTARSCQFSFLWINTTTQTRSLKLNSNEF